MGIAEHLERTGLVWMPRLAGHVFSKSPGISSPFAVENVEIVAIGIFCDFCFVVVDGYIRFRSVLHASSVLHESVAEWHRRPLFLRRVAVTSHRKKKWRTRVRNLERILGKRFREDVPLLCLVLGAKENGVFPAMIGSNTSSSVDSEAS